MAKISLVEKGGTASNASDNRDKGKGSKASEPRADDAESVRVMADPSTNSVVLYGTPAEARAMEEILKRLDVPAKQVSLEAKIVAISKDASRDLGVEWSWQSHRQPLERSWRQRWEQESYIKDPSSSTIRYGIGPGVLGYNVYLDAKVDALVTSGKAKLLSRPNITTLQGHEAVIEIGGEVPVPEQTTANNITTSSIKYRKAGIILRYTPRVNDFGDITASVHTEVSSPLYVDDIKAYRFQTRSADTNVRLRDGETMVIGGLIGSEEAQRLSKIPFLGDLPVLGHFFRHTSKSRTESELLIFLKARILDDKDMIVDDTERIEEEANGNKNTDSR
jgi:type IV pilus assembly protein PilQ